MSNFASLTAARKLAADNFHEAFQQLNLAQKQAVEALDGPVMVVAGPGTGKTQVLVTRIANILAQTDTQPNAILALTFTDSAAQNMRERLVGLIGQVGYSVRISTFHAFCSELISGYPEYFPIDRGSEPMSELERYDLLRRLVVELGLQKLQPLNDPYYYIRDCISALSDLKREGVGVGEFRDQAMAEAKLFSSQLEQVGQFSSHKDRRAAGLPSATDLKKSLKAAEKNLELAELYDRYEHDLRATKRYDFDDMISLVVAALKDHELFRSEQQENLQYFLVDEYQDTNAAQDQILQLLAEFWGEAANVFVVGDPNQAIFRFQGASVENMLGFAERFPAAQVITLSQGYRCPQPLYAAAAELISHNGLTNQENLAGVDLAAPLIAAKKSSSTTLPLRLVEFPSQTLEIWWVVAEIKRLLSSGLAPEKIAVIYRHNADRLEIIEALGKSQIGFEIDGGGDVLAEPLIVQLLLLFRVIVDQRAIQSETNLMLVMLCDWIDLPRLTVMKLTRAAQQNRRPVGEIIEGGLELWQKTIGLENLSEAEMAPIKIWYEQLQNWAVADANLTLTAWFEKVLTESKFLNYIQTLPDRVYQLTVINSLFAQVKSLVGVRHELKLAEFLTALATMQEHHLAIKVDDLNLSSNQVRLTTAHRAKGQEWEVVFILHCADKKWSNSGSRKQFTLPASLLKHTQLDKKDANEDERRLFYVALTRAKQAVYCCYPLSFQRAGRTKTVLKSQFLEELGVQAESETPSNQLTQTDLAESLVTSLRPVVQTRDVSAEKAFFAQTLKTFKLSVTALNTYLRDPETFILNDLLRIPRAKAAPMVYGTAVHAAMERAYRFFQAEGALPKISKIQGDFQESLKSQVLNEIDFERRLIHGNQALEYYFNNYQTEQPKIIMLEKFFGNGASPAMLGDIKLTGRIDRIDLLEQTSKQVRVIDYKTGQPKTDNEICGLVGTEEFSQRELALPETIRGPYQRQLVFYKLLTQLDKQFPYQVTEGMFDFIEPKELGGKLIRRNLALTETAVTDLKDLIKTVMAELRSLDFVTRW